MIEHRVQIEKLAFGGNGVGRINGKVCFVPFSAPGDNLIVRIVEDKRSYVNAHIVEVITPSPGRIVPRCPLFESCGGCNWQHLAYADQLQAKRKILSETLWRSARVSSHLVVETVPAPVQYSYRSRVQFKLHSGPDKLDIGFYRQGSHQVEDAPEGCPIALPVINEALKCLRILFSSFPEANQIPQINIDCADQGCIAIVKYTGCDDEGVKTFIRNKAGSLGPVTGIFLQTGKKSPLQKIWGSELLTYSLPVNTPEAATCALRFKPGGFSQVNIVQNRAIMNLIRELANFGGGEQLLDLYCGNGNFSIPFSGEVASITGIEEHPGSIAAAVDNCRLNSVANAKYFAADAASGVRRLANEGQRFDVCILDPPRSGASDSLKEISRLHPRKIIYISCDPNTLARDCNRLSTMEYQVQKSIPIDMFPQTYHIESITLLQKG
ncbi:MAG TPA: 23S rRNA (uracil(1939)-C(5))-methyltransferase RlmD [Negativicutes bacterium]|jgi:23S rRNA (uracil1939-C5)-methyltransferase